MNKRQALLMVDSIMSSAKTETHATNLIVVPEIDEFDKKELMSLEYDTLGFYLKDNPLDLYRTRVSQLCSSRKVNEKPTGEFVLAGGRIIEYKPLMTKKGAEMAFIKLEDYSGRIDVVVFPGVFTKFKTLLENNAIIEVEGKVESSTYMIGEEEIKINKVMAFKIAKMTETKKITKVRVLVDSDKQVNAFAKIMSSNPGEFPVDIIYNRFEMPSNYRISNEAIAELESMARIERIF